jgi:hypothetical protein
MVNLVAFGAALALTAYSLGHLAKAIRDMKGCNDVGKEE